MTKCAVGARKKTSAADWRTKASNGRSSFRYKTRAPAVQAGHLRRLPPWKSKTSSPTKRSRSSTSSLNSGWSIAILTDTAAKEVTVSQSPEIGWLSRKSTLYWKKTIPMSKSSKSAQRRLNRQNGGPSSRLTTSTMKSTSRLRRWSKALLKVVHLLSPSGLTLLSSKGIPVELSTIHAAWVTAPSTLTM